MKNIFVEGIQGTGKSTMVNHLSRLFPEARVCREGDFSPVDLAWCARMTADEYNAALRRYEPVRDEIIKNTVSEKNHFIITYTRIITDIPHFHKELEEYEVYNGRKSLPALKELILSRFADFKESGYIFECSFFQNIIEDLILFHLLSDDEITEFYRELYRNIDKKQFLLLYLYCDDLEASIDTIKKERCDDQGNELWYRMMLQYLAASPYGQRHGCDSFEAMTAHFKHRQELELRIIKEVIGDNAAILPSKRWKPEEVLALI